MTSYIFQITPSPQYRENMDGDIIVGSLKMTAWFAVIFRKPTRISQYKLAGTMALSVLHAHGYWQ